VDGGLMRGLLAFVLFAAAGHAQILSPLLMHQSGFPTYTDNFMRANAVLSAPWAKPVASSTGGDLQIISDLVYAHGTQPGAHYLDIYTGGIFGSDQYCIVTVKSVALMSDPGGNQGCVLRGKTANQYYNDIVPNPSLISGRWALGIDDGTDFVGAEELYTTATGYAVGDTHELDVMGSNPTFFWAKHNGVMEATGVDTATNYTDGVPGFGSVVDMNDTPTVASGPWTGGTLPALSGATSDTFHRADSGWLGIDWWFAPRDSNTLSFACAMGISGNTAQEPSGCGGNEVAVAVRMHQFGSAQASLITYGSATGGFEGPVARLTPGQTTTTFYLALWYSNTITLYAQPSGGSLTMIDSVGTLGSAPTTFELDASGTGPVVLTVKVNGSVFGSPYTDSSYEFNGSYEGFATDGGGTYVLGWSGN
jgi:hypothetical protein